MNVSASRNRRSENIQVLAIVIAELGTCGDGSTRSPLILGGINQRNDIAHIYEPVG